MAMFYQPRERTGAYAMVAGELTTLRGQLKDRADDLEKAEQRVVELKEARERLSGKIAQLEHDQRALDRGYIALMGDAAVVSSSPGEKA